MSMPDQPGAASGSKVARPLWLAICESVVGRRRKVTEGQVVATSSPKGVNAQWHAALARGVEAMPQASQAGFE
jgi:hypothetical protein